MEGWKDRIYQLDYRHNPEDARAFVALVDNLVGKVDLDTARLLMKTFIDEPDYGVQESVIAALSSAASDVRVQAILEDLPRLQREAPDWTIDLLSNEIDLHPSVVSRIARELGEPYRSALEESLSDEGFARHHRNAKSVISAEGIS